MSPGINDRPPNTGTLPKGNRCINRNRERDRSTVNHNSNWNDRLYQVPMQLSNKLFQLDWHPAGERQVTTSTAVTNNAARTSKNSNTRTTFTAAPYESFDFGFYNIYGLPRFYSHQEITPSFKMTPPIDPRTQSPPNDPAKPTNMDRMPERGQVEGRLNQIREYIKITSTMMESLSQSSDSRARTQHEKLSKMVEDLYDSEQKLSKLMDECQKYWRANENGELENGQSRREQDLRKKVEESQRKLAQLQEHQAHLVGMQLCVKERLNEARQTQRALLAEEANESNEMTDSEQDQEAVVADVPTASNVERLERETEALRGKLEQLENKKRHMDHLVQELQAVDLANERAASGSDSSRTTGQRDKFAELQAMKAQLSHLKSLMDEATRCRENAESRQPSSEPEHSDEAPSDGNNLEDINHVDENQAVSYSNFFNETEESTRPKRSGDPPTVEQIQAVTRELKEQQLMLQSARAELQRLKQGTSTSVPSSSVASSTPPLIHGEKKQSNKRQMLENFVRKDQNGGSIVNQNGGQEWGSRRNSNSINSHGSTSGNIWPPANLANGSNDHSVDGTSATDNLLELGSQPPLENGFGGNYWEMPSIMANQPSQGAVVGSTEYYKQLLLGSQAQQLQMMSTTVQQCCQLLWAQQREMQSMRAAIVQLQAQNRQTQLRPSNNLGLHEDQHSNLGRAAGQQHFSALDAATLPPSSSLPNLVSLPSSSPAPSLVVSSNANCQQQQQPPPQLNNQVPPGNRANNYWDNFRSYSRQNLLSGSSKTVTDCTAGTSTHAPSSTNITSGVTGSQVNSKCNRQHDLEHSAMPSSAGTLDTTYSLNLQPCGRQQPLQQLQQQDRESASSRNNYAPAYDVSLQQVNPQHQQQQQQQQYQQQQQHQQQQQQQQQEQEQLQKMENVVDEAIDCFHSQFRPRDGKSYSRISKKISEREEIKLILMHCLKALDAQKQNENPLAPKYSSNTSDSSDDESETGAPGNTAPTNSSKTNAETQITFKDIIESSRNCITSTNLLDELYRFPLEEFETSILPNSSNSSGANDSSELEKSQSDPSNNNQVMEVMNHPSPDAHDNISEMEAKSELVENSSYTDSEAERISEIQFYNLHGYTKLQ